MNERLKSVFYETHAIREARDDLRKLRFDEQALVDDELSVFILRAQDIWPKLLPRQRTALGLPCIGVDELGREMGEHGLFEHNPSCTFRGRKHENYLWIRTEFGRVCWVLFNTLNEAAMDELADEAQKLKLGY